ncbi:MAG: prolyl oligopeptidase family serine peptidase [Kofleriaceae bacterium]
MQRVASVCALVLFACGGPAATTPRATVAPPPSPGASLDAGPDAAVEDDVVPPVAAIRPVTDRYHGVAVADPYQWLEADDPEVAAWSAGQDRFARAVLDAIPGLATLTGELRAYLAAPITRYSALTPSAGKVFALRKTPAAQQRDLVVMDAPERADAARLVLDPTAGGDAHQAIDWFVPSPDGTKLAVSLSSGGSEAGTLHVIGLDGQDLEPPIPNVQRGTGGGDVAWRADGQALWYTRYPAPGERPDDERDFWMQVWSHQLGTPAADDRYEFGRDLPKIAEILLDSDADGRLLASVQNGDGGVFQHYLRDPRTGRWRQLTRWDDQVVSAVFGAKGDLWLVSTKGAPRGQLLRLPASARSLRQARRVVAQGPDTIVTSFSDDVGPVVTRDRVYLTYQTGGPSEVRAFTLAGKPAPGPALPKVAAAYLLPRPVGADLLVWSESYVTPGAWFRFTPATGALTEVAPLSPRPPVSLAGWEVRRELASSADGTSVPVNIVWRTGTPQDGTTPCVVTGYGGFGISLEPGFVGNQWPLLKRGVCFAVVNLRGGAEFGEAWHQAGMLTNKQHVFDDFAAALDHLVARGYTSPARTAIIGGSNGGLLMGAALTQHPGRVAVVVAKVGIYDMLRTERSANGLFNTTEYGSVTDPTQFAALYAYSPYHHVTPQTRYPAVLMTTGANDPRVAPWQSRKMIAALQAAQVGDAPILLRTSATSGHGQGTSMDDRIAEDAHVDAFILAQLGVPIGP